MKKKLIKSLICICLVQSSFSQKKNDSLNACWIIKHPMNTSYIQKHANIIITRSKDDCVLSLVKRLVDSSSNKNGIKYLKAISEIRKISDGYVSEYFDEVGSQLLYKGFDNFLALVYSKNSRFDDPLEKIVIQSIGTEIADASNPNEEKKKLETFLSKKSLKLNAGKKNYLNDLIKQIYRYAEQQ